MNKKEAKIAGEMVKTSADSLDTAHRALTNTLAFLERSPIQGMNSIDLLKEAFAFVYELRKQVEKAMAESKQKENTQPEPKEEAPVEKAANQA